MCSCWRLTGPAQPFCGHSRHGWPSRPTPPGQPAASAASSASSAVTGRSDRAAAEAQPPGHQHCAACWLVHPGVGVAGRQLRLAGNSGLGRLHTECPVMARRRSAAAAAPPPRLQGSPPPAHAVPDAAHGELAPRLAEGCRAGSPPHSLRSRRLRCHPDDLGGAWSGQCCTCSRHSPMRSPARKASPSRPWRAHPHRSPTRRWMHPEAPRWPNLARRVTRLERGPRFGLADEQLSARPLCCRARAILVVRARGRATLSRCIASGPSLAGPAPPVSVASASARRANSTM